MGKNNFDFLRFAFALIVVLSHIVDLSLAPELQFLKPFFDSQLSVTSFFIISGCLIAASYQRSSSLKSYFSKRASRLLPAYMGIIILCVGVFSFFSSLSFQEYFTSKQVYSYLASNLLFVNFIQPCLPGVLLNNAYCAINGALWTIKVEVSFYVLLPVIMFGLNRISYKLVYLIVIYMVGVLYHYGLLFGMQAYPNKAPLLNTLLHQLPGYLSYFAAGILVFYYLDWIKKHLLKLLAPAMLVFVLEYVNDLEVFKPIALAILITYLAFGLSFLNNFGKYGDVSYGIYILHFPLIQLLVSLGLFKQYNVFLLLFAIVFVVIGLGFVSWHLVEKPFLKRKIAPEIA